MLFGNDHDPAKSSGSNLQGLCNPVHCPDLILAAGWLYVSDLPGDSVEHSNDRDGTPNACL